ncbi:MAG: hypothetical protein ISP01_07110 [Methanobrevibacter arboriphilus]|uniref:Uncharacterized protein n=1 Tax=Methanobrevibacter arboriphilus TaxID=39441 RepID=A0A843API0_METAZ|nr:hypothetical protein [Methanobrevibacter arboriphilus]MBF4469159.1 hypothetical protein [Methanobrevibacter arboriphilus]
MIAKLNFYNKDKLFITDYTEDFQTATGLKEYFNKIKSFIVKSIVLNLEHYEIREVSSDFDRDIDVDIYCNITAEVKSEKIINNQKKLFDFKNTE